MTARPELEELFALLDSRASAQALVCAPGGWRTLSEHELEDLHLSHAQRRKVGALQRLVRHGFPVLNRHQLATPDAVAAVYGERLGAHHEEVMIAIALDGRNRVIAEVEVARGGRHGLVLTAPDVLRPMIRAGASAFIVLHNHPSGSPSPSEADLQMTEALSAAADIVGVPLVDHLIVAAHGGGFTSLAELGFIQPQDNDHEQAAADAAF